MKHVSKEKPAEKVHAWRNGTAADSPAGPLFTSGVYAESELTMTGAVLTAFCGTDCSYSHTRYCC
ncbi:MAG: hypothetical protein HOV87_26110 [Catenulispora sp.]|nr:hypothetical protein [Catenulispora sp.]